MAPVPGAQEAIQVASELGEFLKQTDLFRTVPDILIETIEGHLTKVCLPAGRMLFHEGEGGDAVYVIAEGALALQSGGVHLLTRTRGECVGEFALIDDGPRSAAAAAETDVVVYKWERKNFEEMLSTDAGVARGIFRMLTGKLRQDVERRVAMVAEQERWRQDLARAREIQSGMLPPQYLQRGDLEIAGHCRPAAEVGGDFYDYIEFDGDEVGLVIGDVTGHGFYSGLFVAMAKSCIHTQARVAHTPAAMMRSLRLALSLSIQQHLLMTCCYVAVNSRRRSLSYANAGHPYPYHYRPATGALTRMQALDPILGALDVDAVEFEERTLEFQPGDFLVMYSDGVSEARDENESMFEEKDFEPSIREHCKASAIAARDGILDALSDHRKRAPQGDDMTLVVACARRSGGEGEA